MENLLFPNGTSDFVDEVNNAMKALVAPSQARHVLQLTQDIMTSVLYGHTQVVPQQAPLLPHLLTNTSVEDSMDYQCERHQEVTGHSIKFDSNIPRT